jgi:hypothetical protein
MCTLATARPSHPQTHPVQKEVHPVITEPCLVKRFHHPSKLRLIFDTACALTISPVISPYDPPHLPRRDPPQKGFPNQYGHIFSSSLQSLRRLG